MNVEELESRCEKAFSVPKNHNIELMCKAQEWRNKEWNSWSMEINYLKEQGTATIGGYWKR